MKRVIKHLINNYENGHFTTYGEAAMIIGCNAEHAADYIIQADEICKDNGIPPISSLLVNTDGICGDGYFTYHFPHDKRDKLTIWSEQISKLRLSDLKAIFEEI